MKVLVLDKSSADLNNLVSQLKSMEFDVLYSSNGMSAICLYQTYLPDIIVMDPCFNDIHGYEIIKAIKKIDNTDISVLFVGHNVTTADVLAGLSIGGEYLPKPLNSVLFEAKIKSMQRMIVMRQRYAQMSLKLQQASEDLRQFTHIDNLTGLINRSYLYDSIQKEIHRGMRYQQSIAIVYIEVDCFVAYREFYGLKQSDVCLKQIADILTGYCRRSTDIAAHCGAELFALVLPDTSTEAAIMLAQKICDAVESAQIPHSGSSVADVCTVTIGVISSVPQQGEKTEHLLRRLDTTLSHARKAGCNRVGAANSDIDREQSQDSRVI